MIHNFSAGLDTYVHFTLKIPFASTTTMLLPIIFVRVHMRLLSSRAQREFLYDFSVKRIIFYSVYKNFSPLSRYRANKLSSALSSLTNVKYYIYHYTYFLSSHPIRTGHNSYNFEFFSRSTRDSTRESRRYELIRRMHH